MIFLVSNESHLLPNDILAQSDTLPSTQQVVQHNLSRTAAEKIFNYAYDDKHAYGFHEVRWELERLVELVSEILAEQRNKKDGKK